MSIYYTLSQYVYYYDDMNDYLPRHHIKHFKGGIYYIQKGKVINMFALLSSLDIYIQRNLNTIKNVINSMMEEVNDTAAMHTIMQEICNQTGLSLTSITDDDGNVSGYCWSDGDFVSELYDTPEEAYIAITSRLF